MKLTCDEVEKYRNDGFIGLNRQLFSADKFQALKTDVEELVKKYYKPEESSTLTAIHMNEPHFVKWAASPEILDKVEQIIGPNIGLWAITMFLKRARSTKFVDWHCDSKVLQAYKAFDTLDHVALLVALSPNTISQGCVRYIPGSHTHRGEREFNPVPYEGSLFGGVIHSLEKREYAEEAHTAVPVELNEGEFSFHDIHSVHCSDANGSDTDRILLNFKFFPTHVKPQPEKLKERLGAVQDCFLMRGVDIASDGFLKPL